MRRLVVVLGLMAQSAAAECVVRDFLTFDLPRGGDPVEIAIEAAYPGADLDPGAGRLTLPGGAVIEAGPAREVTAQARLEGASLGDMFVQVYPLAFDPADREVPWADPGRVRHDGFFRGLYGESAAEVGAGLQRVVYEGAGVRAEFTVTGRQCVAVQLGAALAEIAAMEPPPDAWFREAGGGFNWRVIAGTDRLSAHAFGVAVDLNAALGGYWRWSGAAEGAVGPVDSAMPEGIVAAFERRGFIWGGKWHHFDGMHFEYRPDLILYSRLAARV